VTLRARLAAAFALFAAVPLAATFWPVSFTCACSLSSSIWSSRLVCSYSLRVSLVS